MDYIQYFETIKCFDEEVLNLEFHNNRVARTIGLNLNLHDYIFAPSSELLRCKVIYDESGVQSVEFFPYEKKQINSFKFIYDDKIDYSKKRLDRGELDSLFAQRDGADEIIIVQDGLITDTSIANIAVEIDGFWFTPKKPLLQGTTRDRYIEQGIIKQKDITVDMLKNAKRIALLNAMVDFDIKEDFELI